MRGDILVYTGYEKWGFLRCNGEKYVGTMYWAERGWYIPSILKGHNSLTLSYNYKEIWVLSGLVPLFWERIWFMQEETF